MIKKLILLAFCQIFLFCTREEIKPINSNGIFLNEVAAKVGEDWIEIYNDLEIAVDLSGYKIYDSSEKPYTLSGLTISPKGYLVLICDGTGTGITTSFRLSSSGEAVSLESPNGQLVDKVEYPSMSGSQSYARFPDGGSELLLTGSPTQGFSNGAGQTPTLRNVIRDPLIPSISTSVKISAEVLDSKGLKSVKLNYRFNSNPFQVIPMTLIGSNYVASIPPTGATGQIDYYIEAINNRDLKSIKPVTAPSVSYFYILNTDPIPPLVINEYLSANVSCCSDPDGFIGEFDDWIEIFNPGDVPVDIGGMYLSDSLANPFKYRVPSGQSSKTTIAAGGYLVIYADEQGNQGPLHINFKLSQFGEEIGLFYKDGRKIDTRIFGPQEIDISEGRTPNGSPAWSKMIPTRGSANK